MTKILGITGAARSGKDSFAEIAKQLYDVETVSFAAPLREFICKILSVSLSELDSIKETPHELLGGKTPRYALQTLGTEWGRDTIQQNLWVDIALDKIKHISRKDTANHIHPPEFIIVTDVRFDSEAEAIKKAGGDIIKIVRSDVQIEENSHASESGISSDYILETIYNDGTFEQYTQKVIAELFLHTKESWADLGYT